MENNAWKQLPSMFNRDSEPEDIQLIMINCSKINEWNLWGYIYDQIQ